MRALWHTHETALYPFDQVFFEKSHLTFSLLQTTVNVKSLPKIEDFDYLVEIFTWRDFFGLDVIHHAIVLLNDKISDDIDSILSHHLKSLMGIDEFDVSTLDETH